jgi:hypothetical protein
MSEIIALFAVAWGLMITILWLIIGWRAMSAHERIAELFEKSLRDKQR